MINWYEGHYSLRTHAHSLARHNHAPHHLQGYPGPHHNLLQVDIDLEAAQQLFFFSHHIIHCIFA